MIIICSYSFQVTEAIILNLNNYNNGTTLSSSNVMMLALSSAILRVLSDVYMYFLLIRALKFILKKGVNKWMAFLAMIILFTLIETIFIFSSRITHAVLKEYHGLVIVFGAEIWVPINRFFQFAGFLLFFSY